MREPSSLCCLALNYLRDAVASSVEFKCLPIFVFGGNIKWPSVSTRKSTGCMREVNRNVGDLSPCLFSKPCLDSRCTCVLLFYLYSQL